MRIICLLLLALTFTTNAKAIEPNLKWGKPTDEELQMTEYDGDKDADAVVLYHKTAVYYTFLNGGFKVTYRVNTRLKVLKPEGKRVADGRVAFINSENSRQYSETVAGLKATAYNLEGGKLTKTKMENSMVNEERVDKNQKLLKFSVPQVKVGTVIEYEYRIESEYFFDIRDWHAQWDIPVVYTCYELSIPEWFTFNINETGVNHLENETKDEPMTLFVDGDSETLISNVQTFTGRNLPALKDDDYVWCAEDYGSKVTAELAGIYIPGAVYKNYTSTWPDIDKLLMNDDEFGGRLKKSSPLKADIIAAGIPGIADKEERFVAVWQLLKSKVRWNGDYAFWGKSDARVLKEGTGTNADINFLLINMLHDAGMEAAPVVMRTRDEGMLPLTHSSLKFLNTFAVAIQLNDSAMAFFDSSAEDGYLNVIPANMLVSKGRLIKKDGSGGWVNLQEPARSREVRAIQAQLSADGTITGNINSILSEEAAAALRRTWRQAKDSVEQIHNMQEKLGIEIQSYQTEGRYDFSPVMKEQAAFTKQCATAGDIIYLNPLIVNTMQSSPFTVDTRDLPIEFPFKMSETLTVIVSLPQGYAVEEVPKPIQLKFDGISARIICNVKGNTLSTQYKLSVDKTFFAATDYEEMKSFFDRLVECCANIITIKKTL